MAEFMLINIGYPAAAQHQRPVLLLGESKVIGFLLSFIKARLDGIETVGMVKGPQGVDPGIKPGCSQQKHYGYPQGYPQPVGRLHSTSPRIASIVLLMQEGTVLSVI
jgi:hypothetical protein